MSKILQLTAENVKRLHAVQITPSGNLVVIGGKNGQGKTSVLDAIAMAIGGADEVPSMPVRRGEEKAKVVLDLGDIIVRRTFTAKEGGDTTSSLVVENKDKMRASAPQAILDKLTGKVTFDPLAFISMDAPKQAATLKRLVGLDLSALDAERAKVYAERTLVNRDYDRENTRATLMPKHADAPAEEQSVAEIVAERDGATAHNAKLASLSSSATAAARAVEDATTIRRDLAAEIQRHEEQLAALRKRAEAMDANLPRLQADAAAAKKAQDEFRSIDLAPINQRLANAELTNRKVRENRARAEAEKTVLAIKAKADALTAQIERIDQKKDEQLGAVVFPVPGLSFDKTTGGVLFNGVPFDQASGAERMRVSVAIAAAMNPKLRVMLVRDGSLLDEDGLAQLAKLAAEFDLQVWIERVGHGAECSVIIEDGAVKGADVAASGKEAA